MHTKRHHSKDNLICNRLSTYQSPNELNISPRNLRNWKSVNNVCSRKTEPHSDDIKTYLRKYFIDHMSTIHQNCKNKDYVDKQTFERILRSPGILINDDCLEILWNSCEPSSKGIPYDRFVQNFASDLKHKNGTNSNDISKDDNTPSNQCPLFDCTTRIAPTVKNCWQHLKDDFSFLDQYGRLSIPIDQAISLMRKYSFPLTDNQQCQLALLFSTKSNGQFNYFDFMKCFCYRPLKIHRHNAYSRMTFMIDSKQQWTQLPTTLDIILNRIRTQCIHHYGSLYRMFKLVNKNRQGCLTKNELKYLLEQFNIKLDDEEFYHLFSEIDKNQDGILSYHEFYAAVISDVLIL